MSDFKQMPTVASVHAMGVRLAAATAQLEDSMNNVWESIEELNLRVLFLMNILEITEKLSPIADSSGKIPVRKMKALEAYLAGGGRERLVAQLDAQANRIDEMEKEKNQSGKGIQAPEGLETTDDRTAEEAHGAADADASNTTADHDSAPTLVVNGNSRLKH